MAHAHHRLVAVGDQLRDRLRLGFGLLLRNLLLGLLLDRLDLADGMRGFVAGGRVIPGANLAQHAQHGGHSGLVVVGAVGVAAEALGDGRSAQNDERQRRDQRHHPEQATGDGGQEAHALQQAQHAGDGHADGRVATKQRLEAGHGGLVQEVLARGVVVGHDDDGAAALGYQRALSAVHAHHILATGARAEV